MIVSRKNRRRPYSSHTYSVISIFLKQIDYMLIIIKRKKNCCNDFLFDDSRTSCSPAMLNEVWFGLSNFDDEEEFLAEAWKS